MLPIIPSKIHAVLDYLMGLLLIASPWLFGFSDVPTAKWLMVIVGAGAIVYSLITDYELAALRSLPLRAHLALDAVSGGLLAVAPWLFGFDEYVFWPFVILGVTELIAANLTVTVPDDKRRHAAVASKPSPVPM